MKDFEKEIQILTEQVISMGEYYCKFLDSLNELDLTGNVKKIDEMTEKKQYFRDSLDRHFFYLQQLKEQSKLRNDTIINNKN